MSPIAGSAGSLDRRGHWIGGVTGSAGSPDRRGHRIGGVTGSEQRSAVGGVAGREVDELLDPAEQLRLEVGPRPDRAEDPPPAPGDVRLGRVRPPEVRRGRPPSRASRAGSSATPRGRRAAAGRPARCRRTGGRRRGRARGRHRAGRRPPPRATPSMPVDEVVDEDPEPAPGAGGEIGGRPRRGRRRRRASRRRRPRPAGRRPRPSRRARRRAGPRRGSGTPAPSGRGGRSTATEPDAVRVGRAGVAVLGRDEPHRRPVDPEAGPEREAADRAAPVLERDDVDAAALLDADDGPDPPGLDVLDDESGVGGHLGQHLRPPGGGEDVPGVPVPGHGGHPPCAGRTLTDRR